ncbi:bifunctional metallophosphatase/5'-nucleotidase [Marixanthomonas spongiae]|uniref:Bifunctional metallophosphatase/5'-nucleotidase n=1 Tax=Marixanthomonas spongiae TaxID=2174845 RepID=A0A2U0HW68_9FLAO|nr:bifunctional metallophosphatase/5'-nucleotidase [Marixanthomonas spongiae]PVW13113.1 bifunctional metallophosphatase/5'-nucleotidase [Marixanthomonas spongiae]
MKRRLRLLPVFAVFLFYGCTLMEPIPEEPFYGKGIVTIKFLQVNDVYEIAPLQGGKYGGMARVAYVRDSIKERNPNTFLFMAGDFLNPSLLGNLKKDGERIKGKQMIEVMNTMDFDLVTFGNHEFDLSEEELQKRLNESRFPWVSSNVRHVTPDGTKRPFETKLEMGYEPISDYKTLFVKDSLGNEVRFGFIGLTLDSNPKDYVHYGNVYKEAKRAYELVYPKVDFVIGLTHLTIDQDHQLAKELPEIPLIMGGHEHVSNLEREGNTVIAKADANAISMYIHTLVYNLRTQVLYINSKIMYLDEKVPFQSNVDRVVKKWNEVMETELSKVVPNTKQVIYTPKTPLDGTDSANRSIQTNLGDKVTQAMAFAYNNNVDAALVNGGSFRVDDMLSGNLTSVDIFRVLPFGGSVLKVDIKGDLLKKVLDYGASQQGNGAYLQRHNISVNAKGEWLIGNRPIYSNRTYTIALSDFLLKGLDIPFLTENTPGIVRVYEPKEEELGFDIRKTVIAYLKTI